MDTQLLSEVEEGTRIELVIDTEYHGYAQGTSATTARGEVRGHSACRTYVRLDGKQISAS